VLLQDYLIGIGGGDVTPEMIERSVRRSGGRRKAADEPMFEEVPA
jgi:hypothetical protein